jgi:hypothetical protein
MNGARPARLGRRQAEAEAEVDEAFEAAVLGDVAAIAALRLAADRGLLARLQAGPVREPDARSGGTPLLLAMLRGAGIATLDGEGGWALSPAAARALNAGLLARARFAAVAMADLLLHGDALLEGREALVGRAATFAFFRYDRARGTGAAQLEDTAPWVAHVTALSEREAPALAPLIPVGDAAHLLEVGGNTGVMALALLARHPALRATILDLPAVCHLGLARCHGRAGAERLSFLPGDARETPWPAADAVLFKSVLHDWDIAAVRGMLGRAAQAVPPGGRVIVCERGRVEAEPALSGAAAVANLVFAPFYREPEAYRAELAALGLRLLPPAQARLDMTFHVVAAERPA